MRRSLAASLETRRFGFQHAAGAPFVAPVSINSMRSRTLQITTPKDSVSRPQKNRPLPRSPRDRLR